MFTVHDATRARTFFRVVLALPSVEGPGGQPVFTHSPGTAGVHPAASANGSTSCGSPSNDGTVDTLHLSCDVLGDTVAELVVDGARITEVAPTTPVGHPPVISMWVPRYHGAVALQPHRSLAPAGPRQPEH